MSSLAISLLCRRNTVIQQYCFKMVCLSKHGVRWVREERENKEEEKDSNCQWWLEVGAGLAKKRLTVRQQQKIESQWRGRGCASSPLKDYYSSWKQLCVCVCVCVCERERERSEREETSLPPLKALESVSMVMSKNNWRGSGQMNTQWAAQQAPRDSLKPLHRLRLATFPWVCSTKYEFSAQLGWGWKVLWGKKKFEKHQVKH